MKPSLQALLQRPDIWRAKAGATAGRPTLASGLPTLDHALGGGWPAGALVELLLEQTGIGELRLLLPLLQQQAAADGNSAPQHRQPRPGLPQPPTRQVWIDPPLPPYAPALRQQGIALDDLLIVRPGDRVQWLWACVQALRAGCDVAVLCWPNRHRLRYAELRQLQVTAAEHGSLGFLLHDLTQNRDILQHSTPAALRLQLSSGPAALQIDILKQRGSAAGQRIVMPHAAMLQPPPRRRSRGTPTTQPPVLPRIAPPLFPEVRV
jgi:cell division inhibitor SulA/protein ImuA